MQTAEHQAGAIAQSLYVVQDRERPPRERDAVIPRRLHARGGDGPDARVQVHFVPRRQAHFAGPRRRQNQELERPLGGDRGLGDSHGPDGVRHRTVGQRPHVLDDVLLPPEGVARRVVRSVSHRDRPLHHGTDPLAHPPRGLGLVVPDRSEDRQHVSLNFDFRITAPWPEQSILGCQAIGEAYATTPAWENEDTREERCLWNVLGARASGPPHVSAGGVAASEPGGWCDEEDSQQRCAFRA